jgi:kynureninase|tara:strand:- start:231 stop:1469 length:1239 start_codon:yes stop_codon:yes gene_type:complete
MNYEKSRNFADFLDQQDGLSEYRKQFNYPKDSSGKELIYFCGNSLGLQPKTVSSYLEKELSVWAEKGVIGQETRWIAFHERLEKSTAKLVGALPSEVVVMNALTVNIHFLLVSFYQPSKNRYKIMIEKDAFPSDHYAIQSQIRFHGYDPEQALVELVPRKDEKILRNDDILSSIQDHGDQLSLIYLGGVNYYTGQAFDMGEISKAGKAQGAIVGFNLAHSVGNLPLRLHDWDIDFSAWCTYKYLCAGPGSPSGVFIHERHHDWDGPRFLGWWGHNKDSRFQMPSVFDPILTSEGWQVSNAPVMGMAPLLASMEIYDKVGMNAIRSKGKELSSYMEYLIKEYIAEVDIITPKARGCQLSIVVPGGKDVFDYLSRQGVVCDWRNPDVIRVAPHPLFNTFTEVFEFVKILKKAIA